MANYICSKCGETASSKCARSRNVFPDNVHATLLSNMTDFEIDRTGKFPSVQIKMNYMDKDSTDIELYTQMIQTLQYALEKGTLEKSVCSHRWKLESDHCDLDCCSKEK